MTTAVTSAPSALPVFQFANVTCERREAHPRPANGESTKPTHLPRPAPSYDRSARLVRPRGLGSCFARRPPEACQSVLLPCPQRLRPVGRHGGAEKACLPPFGGAARGGMQRDDANPTARHLGWRERDTVAGNGTSRSRRIFPSALSRAPSTRALPCERVRPTARRARKKPRGDRWL
jgi:hypothetical protein